MTREELKQAAIDYLGNALRGQGSDARAVDYMVQAATEIVLERPPYTSATLVPTNLPKENA